MTIDFSKVMKSAFDQAMEETELKIGMTVKEAIERLTPAKPLCKKYTDDTRCPTCDTFVLKGNKHCIECGQAIDWSDR